MTAFENVDPAGDLAWFSKVRCGNGVAKAIVLWIESHAGASQSLGLDYRWLVHEFEFTEKQIRSAVERLVARGYATILPARGNDDVFPHGEHVLQLLTPTYQAYAAHEREKAQAKASRRAQKIAARGGRIHRAAIPDVVKARVYARDNFTCQKCGATDDLTLDHIHPWSIGGPDTEDNLRVLCRPCNSAKGDRT
jgi:5-methylcytosine-specific restriction endonuclease McrA